MSLTQLSPSWFMYSSAVVCFLLSDCLLFFLTFLVVSICCVYLFLFLVFLFILLPFALLLLFVTGCLLCLLFFLVCMDWVLFQFSSCLLLCSFGLLVVQLVLSLFSSSVSWWTLTFSFLLNSSSTFERKLKSRLKKVPLFLGSVPASIYVTLCVRCVCACLCVCVCGRPTFSSRNDHFQSVAPLDQLINQLIN